MTKFSYAMSVLAGVGLGVVLFIVTFYWVWI